MLIEAYTYRMGAHTTSDDPTKYRISAEVEVWKLRDPIARLKAYLTSSLKADRAYFDSVDAEADELAATVRQGCLAMPDPEPLTMFDNIYVDDHPLIDAERARFAEYAASFEGGH
jgi:pyruvate dehydrogenase E1 component alpha subunit